MRNTEIQTTTAVQERLAFELKNFIADVPAPDASDSLLHLLTQAGSDLSLEESKALHSVLFLLNAIDRVQREELSHVK